MVPTPGISGGVPRFYQIWAEFYIVLQAYIDDE